MYMANNKIIVENVLVFFFLIQVKLRLDLTSFKVTQTTIFCKISNRFDVYHT